MTFNYHEKFDVLYVIFGDTCKPADYIENDNGDVIRFTPDTGQVVGITIFDFLKRLKNGEKIKIPEAGLVPFNAILDNLIKGHQSGTIEE